ncbi:MAG: DNA translocase FtsK [Desulfovibrionales bacterium]|nr:MAG: DNA translocase FtsK [Desulfovibrionales bacterium]
MCPAAVNTDAPESTEVRLIREICALTLLFVAAFLTLSLLSYHPQDPSFNQQATSIQTIHNQAGIVGAYIAGLFVDLFGLLAVVFPVVLIWLALACVWRIFRIPWWRWLGLMLLFLALLAGSHHPWAMERAALGSIQGGGYFGDQLHGLSIRLFHERGALLLWLFMIFLASQLLFGVYWTILGRTLGQWASRPPRPRSAKSKTEGKGAKQKNSEMPVSLLEEFKVSGTKKQPPKAKEVKKERDPLAAVTEQLDFALGSKDSAFFPNLNLLTTPDRKQPRASPQRLQELASSLGACLADFGVQGEVQDIQPGPVVTMFEYKPAPGVKISRIAGLSDDLSLGLKAASVRVVAPLQGKDTVGVEIPNEQRQSVWLREILESGAFQASKSKLTIAIGKDIEGKPVVADLARMPHLLVAGATGAGKSVGLNAMIVSILFKARPDEVKFLLVDPKRIELAVYAKLPHLVHPVVTEMALAKSALEWAMAEMDARYESMAALGVRHISSYQQKIAAMEPEEAEQHRSMPYLVIIIDELADLMLTAGKEVEVSIVRLAQLARAAGIHMILATQRPSVDVVTGLIKANFPCRISFQVTSKHDSRTILDSVGAEHLLGQGDMLFKPSAGKLQRMHGAFVGDDEIAAVVQAWHDQQQPSFELDFNEWAKEEAGGSNGFGPEGSDVVDDPIYNQAVEFVLEQGRASISLLQRRFRIGFNRSARFIEQMEKDGLLGAQEGSKPRAVIKSKK